MSFLSKQIALTASKFYFSSLQPTRGAQPQHQLGVGLYQQKLSVICQMTVSKGRTAPTAIYLEGKDGLQALEKINTVILDCDGVLWRGSELIPGTLEGLAALRNLGKRLLFVTNNSSKSRQQYLSKFTGLGIQVDAQELVPTSYAAAAYLQSISFRGKVFLVGGTGMEQELQEAGIEYVTFDTAAGQQGNDGAKSSQPAWSLETFRELQLAEGIQAVVVGYDEQFTYEKLCYASACLREIPNCLFVATNLDNADHIGDEMAVSMHLLHAHVQQCASFSSAAAGNWIKALASLCACCSSSVLLAFGMCGQHCKACCNMVWFQA